ncbi:MAG: hypothetical protein K6F50_07905 [Kiritimatiellae bacterium]|nr:hypothetical protein [Kiritimatiellia bacterium]
MTQKHSLFAAAAMVGSVAFAAQETWFTAPVDSTMDGWSGDTRTFTDADTDYIEVVTTDGVTYTPAGSTSNVVRETVMFMSDAYDTLPDVSTVTNAEGQTAIAVLSENGTLSYNVAVYTNGAPAWVKLTGATPAAEDWLTLVLEFDYSKDSPAVSFYSKSGDVETLLAAEDGNTTFTTLDSSLKAITSTLFIGAGNIAALSGTQGATFTPISVTGVGSLTVDASVFPSTVSASERAAYLVSTQANGLTVWQNYVMGIDGTQADNKLVADYTASGTTLTIKSTLTDLTSKSDAGVTVTYSLLKSTDNGSNWTKVTTGAATPNSFEVNTEDLTAGTQTLFKIQAVFQ